jgi:hypothetical protein
MIGVNYSDRSRCSLKHNAALPLGKLGDNSIVPRMLSWVMVPFDEKFRG